MPVDQSKLLPMSIAQTNKRTRKKKPLPAILMNENEPLLQQL